MLPGYFSKKIIKIRPFILGFGVLNLRNFQKQFFKKFREKIQATIDLIQIQFNTIHSDQ
jgi:hypothetical protein